MRRCSSCLVPSGEGGRFRFIPPAGEGVVSVRFDLANRKSLRRAVSTPHTGRRRRGGGLGSAFARCRRARRNWFPPEEHHDELVPPPPGGGVLRAASTPTVGGGAGQPLPGRAEVGGRCPG